MSSVVSLREFPLRDSEASLEPFTDACAKSTELEWFSQGTGNVLNGPIAVITPWFCLIRA